MVGAEDEARPSADIDFEVVLRSCGGSRIADNQIVCTNGRAEIRKASLESGGSIGSELPRRGFLVLTEGSQRFGRKGQLQRGPSTKRQGRCRGGFPRIPRDVTSGPQSLAIGCTNCYRRNRGVHDLINSCSPSNSSRSMAFVAERTVIVFP